MSPASTQLVWSLVFLLLLPGVLPTTAQQIRRHTLTESRNPPLSRQKDLLDVARQLFPWLHLKDEDTTLLPVGRTFAWVVPALGYSLQTGVLGQIQGNILYPRPGANVSTIIPEVAYTQNKQLFLATKLNIWTRNNRFNWVGDYRLYHFPQATFGLGTSTRPTDELRIDFTYFRFYQSLLLKISPKLYAGLQSGLSLEHSHPDQSGR